METLGPVTQSLKVELYRKAKGFYGKQHRSKIKKLFKTIKNLKTLRQNLNQKTLNLISWTRKIKCLLFLFY